MIYPKEIWLNEMWLRYRYAVNRGDMESACTWLNMMDEIILDN